MREIRLPRHISPSSLHNYERSRVGYFLDYMLHPRRARTPSIPAMDLGSAVDARVKAYLYERCDGGGDDAYVFETLYDTQVADHNRDLVLEPSEFVFEQYKKSGYLNDLVIDLEGSIVVPRFEFTMITDVTGVPILGKPDVYFLNPSGVICIYDFKVNGYFSTRNTSPAKGYRSLYDCITAESKRHKNCVIEQVHGIDINTACPMNSANNKWADQLTMYLWMAGMRIGSMDHVVGIDQFVGKREKYRIAQHRSQIESRYQVQLYDRLQAMWANVVANEVIPKDEVDAYLGGSDEMREKVGKM